MKRHALPAFLVSMILAIASPAASQDAVAPAPSGRLFTIDDSGTVVLDPILKMQWQPVGRSGGGSALVSASTRVSVQLNLAVWSGRTGRIYLTLPRTSGPTVRATWNSGGTLLPGSLISGDRIIVYAGPINGPFLHDLLDLKLEADGAHLIEPQALAFGFEIEVDQ